LSREKLNYKYISNLQRINLKMKTLKTLMEDHAGVVTQLMDAGALRNLRTLTKQMSSVFQPNVESILEKLEEELNKFGYTLGEMEKAPFAADGQETFFVFSFSTKELIQNALFELTWQRLASGQQMIMRPDSALMLATTVRLKEIAPSEMAVILSTFSAVPGENFVGDADF
jgi:hypothetical protein